MPFGRLMTKGQKLAAKKSLATGTDIFQSNIKLHESFRANVQYANIWGEKIGRVNIGNISASRAVNKSIDEYNTKKLH